MRLVGGLLAAAIAFPAPALEVYQWRDENGVIHFSQWAPDEAVENVETIRVEDGGEKDYGIGVSEQDDPDGYQAHREEMEALWAGIEARREAERERQARAPTTEIVYYPYESYDDYPYLFPGFGLPPLPPDRPPHRPRPRPEPLPSVPYKRP